MREIGKARWGGPPAEIIGQTFATRISGANFFFVLLIRTPSTQELEPPENPGRFRPRNLASSLFDMVLMATSPRVSSRTRSRNVFSWAVHQRESMKKSNEIRRDHSDPQRMTAWHSAGNDIR